MSFGLTNTSTLFMDLMNRMFPSYLDKFMIVFVNEILIYSRSKDKHETHLRISVLTLPEHCLYAKLLKCEFWLFE